ARRHPPPSPTRRSSDLTCQALERALGAARVSSAEILAVGITNQRETAILWERASGRPVHNAIVWQCRRTAALCEALKADGAEPRSEEHTSELQSRVDLV